MLNCIKLKVAMDGDDDTFEEAHDPARESACSVQLLFLNKNTLWQRKKTNRINYFNLIICIWLAFIQSFVRLVYSALQKTGQTALESSSEFSSKIGVQSSAHFCIVSSPLFVLAHFFCSGPLAFLSAFPLSLKFK